MKKIFFIIAALLITFDLLAQKKQVLEPYSQKFYKLDKEVYGIKHPKKNREAHLLKSNLRNNEIKQIFPYSHFGLISTLYPGLIYDVNSRNLVLLEKYKKLSGDEQLILSFFPQKEPTEQNWNQRTRTKEEISHNLTGIRDFYYLTRLINQIPDPPRSYWHYDLILQKDETLLMPVGFGDSLYFYQFTDKAWTKPNYQGVEKNKENDKWTRIAQVKHDFKTSFRAFQIQEDTYFLTNSDTSIYKYEQNQLKEIGKIKPKKGERTLFLIDKDDKKVYFLMAESIEIIAEERKRFGLLRKDDELFKAVKRIIDESDRK